MSALKLRNGDWVLVGDGEKALLLRNAGDEQYPDLRVIGHEEHENPSTRAQGADRPGRMADGGVNQRSAMENADWHVIEKLRFADEMADLLYKAAHAGKYERLVIAAPPRVLGELRDKLHKEVEARLVATIDKELTNHPVEKIQKVLTGA